MRWKPAHKALLFLCLSAPAWGLTDCRITIVNEKPNGERIRIRFSSMLKTKSECKALARMHMKNFEPGIIKDKQVSWQWMHKDATVASRPHRRKHRY